MDRKTKSVSCSTCRSRKVKCDRKLPKCSACSRLGLVCGRSKVAPMLVWVGTKDQIHGDSMHNEPEISARRRALYTDEEREAECKKMAAKVSHQHIEVLLQELDGTTTVLGQIDQTQSLGPFGVFSTQPTPSLATDSPTSVQVDGIYPEHIIDDDDSLHVDFRAVPAGLEEQQLINFNLFHSGPFTPLLEDHLDPLFDTAVTGNYDFDALVELVEYEGQSPGNATMEIMRSPSPRSLSLPLHFAGDIGDLAPLITNTLLAHYRETLIANFIPLKQHKPPWTILHLPCAMSAYGEIALLGDTNNAKASLLFAIFAMSALNLDQHQKRDTGKSSQWLAAGELYRERAKCRLQACLREQGGNVKKAKYKEVLMALLSMVTTCVVTGKMDEAKSFLLDAERFIYLRGLPKLRKSKKVLMLHAIFLYLRVVEESTCISDTTPTVPSLPNQAILSNTTSYHELSSDGTFSCRYPSLWTERLRLSLRLELQDTQNLEMAFLSYPQDPTEPTIFEHIYGIPESLFRSISHATYLANEVQRSKFHNSTTTNSTLNASIKALETRICNYQNPYKTMAATIPGPALSPSSDPTNARSLLYYDFLEAIHSALLIYFYRRVRDVHPVILQPYVRKTTHHLLAHETRKAEFGDHSSNFAWPGFIAACEALDTGDRVKLSEWMERSARSSGMGMFSTARGVVERIWEVRAEGGGEVGWGEMIKRGGTALILS